MAAAAAEVVAAPAPATEAAEVLFKEATTLAAAIEAAAAAAPAAGTKRGRPEWKRDFAKAKEIVEAVASVKAAARARKDFETSIAATEASGALQVAVLKAETMLELKAKRAALEEGLLYFSVLFVARCVSTDFVDDKLRDKTLMARLRLPLGPGTGAAADGEGMPVGVAALADAFPAATMLPTAEQMAAVMAALCSGSAASHARQVAACSLEERVKASVQQLVRLTMETVITTLHLSRAWASEVPVEVSARFFKDPTDMTSLPDSFVALADGALLLDTDRHADVVTAMLTCRVSPLLTERCLREAVQLACIRLAHLVSLRRERRGAEWWVAGEGDDPLVAYGLATNGFTLFVVCAEIAAVDGLPKLVWRAYPLPLWSPEFVAAAKCEEGSGAFCGSLMPPDTAPPAGLVALVTLFLADRNFLGAQPYVVPPDLTFSRRELTSGDDVAAHRHRYYLPPPREWQHLGSGGASEVYEVRHGDRILVVKVTRHPAAEWQTLATEVRCFKKLGAKCPAIPRLVAIAYAGGTAATAGGRRLAAIVTAPGPRGGDAHATCSVLAALSQYTGYQRMAYACLAAYSAHNDPRLSNVVWIMRAGEPDELPAVEAVHAALEAARAAGAAGIDADVLHGHLRVRAQLVDWGMATAATPSLVTADCKWLWPLLVNAVLAPHTGDTPDEEQVRPHNAMELLLASLHPPQAVCGVLQQLLSLLQAATSVRTAICCLLALLTCALQAATAWTAADAASAAKVAARTAKVAARATKVVAAKAAVGTEAAAVAAAEAEAKAAAEAAVQAEAAAVEAEAVATAAAAAVVIAPAVREVAGWKKDKDEAAAGGAGATISDGEAWDGEEGE